MKAIITLDTIIPFDNIAYCTFDEQHGIITVGLKHGENKPVLIMEKNNEISKMLILWEQLKKQFKEI